jgi:hypothetical protein
MSKYVAKKPKLIKSKCTSTNKQISNENRSKNEKHSIFEELRAESGL